MQKPKKNCDEVIINCDFVDVNGDPDRNCKRGDILQIANEKYCGGPCKESLAG